MGKEVSLGKMHAEAILLPNSLSLHHMEDREHFCLLISLSPRKTCAPSQVCDMDQLPEVSHA